MARSAQRTSKPSRLPARVIPIHLAEEASTGRSRQEPCPNGLSFATLEPARPFPAHPPAEGSYTFSIRATDTCGRTDTKSYTLLITATSAQIPMIATPGECRVLGRLHRGNQSRAERRDFHRRDKHDVQRHDDDSVVKGHPRSGKFTIEHHGASCEHRRFRAQVSTMAPLSITSAASNSPLTIPVTLRVASPSNIGVAPESLLFRHTPAAPISQQVLNVSGASTGIRFSVTFRYRFRRYLAACQSASGTNASKRCLSRSTAPDWRREPTRDPFVSLPTQMRAGSAPCL